jgi:ParB-like nuclease domain
LNRKRTGVPPFSSSLANEQAAATATGKRAAKIVSWRDVLSVHPAANASPLMSQRDLRALAENITKRGLQVPITVLVEKSSNDGPWTYQLLAGRNRLDACELAGINLISPPRSKGAAYRRRRGTECGLDIRLGGAGQGDEVIKFVSDVDAYAFVVSDNLHRLHHTAEHRRELIAKLIEATPEKSNRQIAETVKADHKTVGAIRAEMEPRGEIPHVETRADSKGRQQPVKRTRGRSGSRMTYRAMKLGDDVMAKIKGTSLDSAAEMDELIILNRGAPEGRHTRAVEHLVAAAAAGKKVSAVAYTKSGAAFRREDIGADSTADEVAELDDLLSAWNRATEGARLRFMRRIGLQLMLPVAPDDGPVAVQVADGGGSLQ